MRPKNIGGESLWGRIKIVPDRYEIISHCDKKWLQFRAISIAKYSGETPLRSHHTQCARLLVYTLFLNKFPDRFDDHHSPQQSGSWKVWQWIYACCAPCPGCIDIKSVWKQSQMIITQETNQTKSITWLQLYTRACKLLLHKDLDYTKSCQLTLLLLIVYYGLTINDVQRVCLRQ